MIMVSAERLESLKKGKMNHPNDGKREKQQPDDVKLKLLYDEQMRKDGREKHENEKNLNKQLQPLLALQSANMGEVLKSIPHDKQVHGNYILQILSRLPKLSIVRNHITIDGEPLKESASQIVNEIIANGITGTKKVINSMRNSKPTTPARLSKTRGGDDTTYHSFSEEMEPLFRSMKDEEEDDEESIPNLSKESESSYASPKATSTPQKRKRSITTPSPTKRIVRKGTTKTTPSKNIPRKEKSTSVDDIDDEETTASKTISAIKRPRIKRPEKKDEWYPLTGRKYTSPQKGNYSPIRPKLRSRQPLIASSTSPTKKAYEKLIQKQKKKSQNGKEIGKWETFE